MKPLSDAEFNALLKSIPARHAMPSTNKPCMHNTALQMNLSNLLKAKKFKRLPTTNKIRIIQYKTRYDLHHIYNVHGYKESMDALLKGPDSDIWQQSLTNKLSRLAQGIGNIEGNDYLQFISKHDVPNTKSHIH